MPLGILIINYMLNQLLYKINKHRAFGPKCPSFKILKMDACIRYNTAIHNVQSTCKTHEEFMRKI